MDSNLYPMLQNYYRADVMWGLNKRLRKETLFYNMS